MNTDAGHKQLSKKKLFRSLVLVCILLAVFAVVFSVFRNIRIGKALAKVDVPQLVRNVRKSENWIRDVNSLLIRVKSKVTRTPKGIAARRAQLKERFPDLKPDPNLQWDLKPSFTGNLEFAFRHGPKENRRLRRLRDTLGIRRDLDIFDGKDLVSYTKYIPQPNEFYIITNPKNISIELFLEMSWPSSQRYKFKSPPVETEQNLSETGSAQGFVCIGREDYRGLDCYVLECDPPAFKRRMIKRWYVGVKDGLLHGNIRLNRGSKELERWMLDYKEVAPGCWYPMNQGYQWYNHKWFRAYLRSRRDLEVIEVRVNEKLPDALFEMKFKPGVKVEDERKYPLQED